MLTKIENKQLRNIMRSKKHRTEHIVLKQESFIDILSPNFIRVYDTIVLAKQGETAESYEAYFETVLTTYQDKTHYETTLNDIFVNGFFENELSFVDSFEMGYLLIDTWQYKLKQLTNNEQIFFSISGDEGYKTVTLHFHKVRENEPLGLDIAKLDDYKQPVGYCFI